MVRSHRPLNATRRTAAAVAGLTILLAHAGLLVPAARADGDAAPCPASFQAWQTEGLAEAGREWTARVLEVRADIGVFRELSIGLESGELPADEARWFEGPGLLHPVTFYTRTRSLDDDELAALCGVLDEAGLAQAREKARTRCFSTGANSRIVVSSEHRVANAAPESAGEIAPSEGLIGYELEEGRDPVDVECVLLDGPFDPEMLGEIGLAQADETGTAAELPAIARALEQLSRRDDPLELGLAALPPARHVLRMLDDLDGERVPQSLGSDFLLALAAAPEEYGQALALERMLTGERAEAEVALAYLGDRGSAGAAQLVRLKLRAATRAGEPRTVSLALRALLRTDPGLARLEAVPLIHDARFTRAALGVFALTDADLAPELAVVDISDPDALEAAGRSVLGHLEAAAGDERLREAAEQERRRR